MATKERQVGVTAIARAVEDGDVNVSHMADDLGVSRAAIYKWVSGESVPSKENMGRVCEYLGISPNEVYGYVGEQ